MQTMDVNEAERLVRGLKVLGVQDIGRSWCVNLCVYGNCTIHTEAISPFRTLLSAGGFVSIASLID
jgi:hypothetical protein